MVLWGKANRSMLYYIPFGRPFKKQRIDTKNANANENVGNNGNKLLPFARAVSFMRDRVETDIS